MPRQPRYDWQDLPDGELLQTRFCDLGLRIAGSGLEWYIRQLHEELRERGLRLRPHCWLSNEWFSPEDVPGIAIPFYLAHPRLRRLEDRMMHDVEGGTRESLMRILRHEAGHAAEVAYGLRRRPTWRRTFGDPRRPYPISYRPRPFSRRYVLHLDWWYAQSHPVEDFAETFAVWLRPGSRWRSVYAGWPALRKLEYVHELMTQLRARGPRNRSRRHVDQLSALTQTLGDHYAARQKHYASETPDVFDRDLYRLFPSGPNGRPGRTPTAASFLRKITPELRRTVSEWTGIHPYIIHQVLKDMVARSRELGLRVDSATDDRKLRVTVLVTTIAMNYVHSRDRRLPGRIPV